MPPVSYLLAAFVLPAVIVAAGIWFRWRWLNAIIFPVAFVIAEWRIHGLPPGVPGTGDAGYWIVWFAVPLLVLGLLDAIFRPPMVLRAGICFVFALIAIHLLLSNLAIASPKDVWTQQTFVYVIAAIAVVMWVSLEGLAEKTPGVTVPIILAIQGFGSAVLLGTENNVVASHGAGALTALSTAAVVVALLRKNFSISGGPVLTISFSLVALLTLAYFYAYPDLAPSSLVYGSIVILAPVLAWAGDLPGIRNRSPLLRLAVRILPVILAVGSAAALSAHDYLSNKPAGQNSSGAEEE